MENFNLFSHFEWESLFQIFLAVVLGGLVGLEREFSGRPAGLRTHILVCLGATIIVLASTSIPRLFGTSYQETLRIDPGRIAAGIVTGIGFLGAGAILRTGELVRGLTTAACIWFAAALGIVIGEGYYMLAICGTAVVLVVLRVDEIFETKISSPMYRTLTARVEASHADEFEEFCKDMLKSQKIRLQDMDCSFHRDGNIIEFMMYLRTRDSMQSRKVISELKDQPGLMSLSWRN
ncbi:MAG: MgtC/SapB family protein [Planctomycetota bacterium]|jgi:putative Mg2+ transporter-C (MgtC) family protein